MSGTCSALAAEAPAGVAAALRAVDCLANETAAAAFGRLFGGEGLLLPALTIVLTLYIALFAVALLTGRSRIGISALTPRMMTLGLVLTFATSWVAYQGVVWNLAVGAPDQIAGVITGARGSATQIFADRIDIVFSAIAEVAQPGGQADPAAGAGAAASGSFTPANLLWLAALLLLLGTVGVLVLAGLALAVLLVTGPVFVVLALFPGTRGLCAGWLRGVVLTAVTPLFVVVGGSLTMELLVPVVAALRSAEGVDGRAALALFLVASVHVALMAMILKVTGSVVSAWNAFGLSRPGAEAENRSTAAPMQAPVAPMPGAPVAQASEAMRRSAVLAGAVQPAPAASAMSPSPLDAPPARGGHTIVTVAAPAAHHSAPPAGRARGIGSRFQTQPARAREFIR